MRAPLGLYVDDDKARQWAKWDRLQHPCMALETRAEPGLHPFAATFEPTTSSDDSVAEGGWPENTLHVYWFDDEVVAIWASGGGDHRMTGDLCFLHPDWVVVSERQGANLLLRADDPTVPWEPRKYYFGSHWVGVIYTADDMKHSAYQEELAKVREHSDFGWP